MEIVVSEMKIKYKVTVEIAVFEIKKQGNCEDCCFCFYNFNNKVTVEIAVSVSVILTTR